MDWIPAVVVMLSIAIIRSEDCITMKNIGLFKAHNGLRYPYLTSNACLKACMVTPSCKAANYDQNESTCYIIEHLKNPTFPNDCCELYIKVKETCDPAPPLRAIFKNSDFSSFMRKRDVLNQNRQADSDGKSLDDVSNKPLRKGDKSVTDPGTGASLGPHFVLVNNTWSSIATTSLSESKNAIANTKRTTVGTWIESTTLGTTRSPTRQTYNNSTMSPGTKPKHDFTQAGEDLSSEKPAFVTPGSHEDVTQTIGIEKRNNGKSMEKKENGKKTISDDSSMIPVQFEATCKKNVTVMELHGRFNQIGGQDVGMTMTSKECQDWCQNNERCVTVDYNLWEHSCWWHWNIGPTRNNSCCTQHRKIETCQYDCFDVYQGYVLNTSKILHENMHVSRCRKECLVLENCTAYVYSNATASCWIYDFDITLLTTSKEPQTGALFSIKKPCYGNAMDTDIYISTTTQRLNYPDFTFPTIPTTLPPSVNGGGTGTTDQPFVMSPSSVVVLAGCSLVLLVGIATLIGFMLHRRREKRALEASFAHPVIWMNDYGNFSSRGQHNFWYPDGACAEFSPPGVALNPAFQGDEFPVGRTSAEFTMMATNGRCVPPSAARVTRTRSYTDGFAEPSPSTYPTFPLRPIRVAVPATASASSPVMTSSTNAHAPSGYTTFSSTQTQADGRRLPRYEINHGMNGLEEDQSTFRCAYP